MLKRIGLRKRFALLHSILFLSALSATLSGAESDLQGEGWGENIVMTAKFGWIL